ncbi:MAG: cytochrome C [Chthonomonadaceae bacterium]|nr:cytochrome C [Chthonomonadaceae bacterium]
MKFFMLVGVLALVLATLHGGKSDDASKSDVSLSVDQSLYAGSEKCASCHKDYSETWKTSAHNKMIRPPILSGPDQTVFADFSKPSEFRPFELKDVKWVIGHRWKQRFIGVVNGEEVVFPAQWSIKEAKWQPYTGKADWWYPLHPDWKTRSNFKLCAGCHSTGVDTKTQTWKELNITCESCHGPGKAHSLKPAVENIVNPARLSTERSVEVCLSCHQAGKPGGDELAWPAGFSPGKKLADYWKGFAPEGKQTSEFWTNGTAHKNRVQGNTFLQSKMHFAGLQCSSCHDSHGSRHTSMTLKSATTNALCLTCHGPGKQVGPNYVSITEHTHHAPNSTGSQCISCHMAKTGENSVGAESRDHTFNFVSPAVSIGDKNVSKKDPNSCNLCHADKTAEWALATTKKWYPKLK